MPKPAVRINDRGASAVTSAGSPEAEGHRFGPFYLDAGNHALYRDGQALSLNPKYLQVLLYLVRRGGTLVSKEELFEQIWGATFVTDAALAQCIKDIRKCLSDSASAPRYIKTLPKRGYLFIGQSSADAIAADVDARLQTRPYKFLESFSEADAGIFYGREDDIEAVCSRILSQRTFLIYGLSGVGKSSFLAAGVIPRLKPGHAICRIRSYHDPVAEIERLLAAAIGGEDTPGKDLVSLCRTYFEQRPESRILFCLDQFEEWFLLLPETGRKLFLEIMKALQGQPFSSRLHFCFVLREDFLAEMSRLKPVFPTIFHHEYRLMMLDRMSAARAVTAPAEQSGCSFEAGLLDRILDDLSESGGIDLPALQIVCDQLYDKRDLSGMLTRAAYEALGQTGGILAAYLDRVLRRFDAVGLKLARLCVSLLITAGGERRVVTSADLIAGVSQESGTQEVAIRAVIEELAMARILRIRQEDGEGWVELVHDYLVETVSHWMSESFKTRRRIREVFERARHNYRDSGLLMGEESLLLTLSQGNILDIDAAGADLLVRSCLLSGHEVPRWLAERCPAYLAHLGAAAASAEPAIRAAAIAASRWAPRDEVTGLLVRLALEDPELAVRKSASIRLAGEYGDEVPQILRRGRVAGFNGSWRYLTSLAMIRDHDIATFSLFSQTPLIGLFIMVCLAWVRLRRNSEAWGRRTLGGTLGTAFAGLTSGLLLAAGVIAFNGALVVDRLALILAFMSCGAVIGLLSGCGVCASLCAVSYATIRHNRFWPLLGAAAGGFLTSMIFNQIANALAVTLLGIPAIETTRSSAVAAIAIAVTLGYVWGNALGRGRLWPPVAGAALGGGIAGALVIFNGGLLLAGSLENLINQFTVISNTRPLFQLQETSDLFRTLLKTGWGFYEGASFGCGLVGGMLWLDKSPPPE